jgi:hypothetical protein
MNLSVPAMQHIVDVLDEHPGGELQGEVKNFTNVLLNLIERGVDRKPKEEASWLDE